MRKKTVRISEIALPSGATRSLIYAKVRGHQLRERYESHAEALGRAAELERLLEEESVRVPLMPTTLTRTQLADAEVAISQLLIHFPRRTLTWAVSSLCDLAPEKTAYELPKAIEEFIDIKRPIVNAKSWRDYQSTLKRLKRVTGRSTVHEIRHEHILAYFERLRKDTASRSSPKKKVQSSQRTEISNGTFNHHLTRLNTFFLWFAKAHPESRQPRRNPCDGVPKRSKCEMSRDILSPEEARELIRFAESFEGGRLINYIALGMFAGLRPDIDGELGKLARGTPANFVDWKFSILRIPASYSKTNRAREIDIMPALESILSSYPLDLYPLQPKPLPHERKRSDIRVLRNALERFRYRSPVKLPHDVLRHSYISYHLRKSGEYAETSRQAGNTEGIIRRHYQRRVTIEEAQAFWNIRPKQLPES